MIGEDDFHYALENTHVILAPRQRIATFGSTSFRFYLVSELMDSPNEVRVRDGMVYAERPQLLSPGHYANVLLDGFGEKARGFADWLEEHREKFTLLKYGFQFRKTDVVENTTRDSIDDVLGRIKEGVEAADEPMTAVIHGVDDAWEVCLLKFTVDLIQQSSGGNMGDLRKKGLL